MYRVTRYTVWQTIQVVDQFGQPLDAVFTGADVFEGGSLKGTSINQQLRQDGTYLDPVGVRLTDKIAIRDDDNVRKAAWEAAPIIPPLLFDSRTKNPSMEDIAVSIAGYDLSPSIVKRRLLVTPLSRDTARVEIIWP